MKKKYKVYLITNNINQKQYVGITKGSLKMRLRQHLNTQSCCRSLKEAVFEFGKSNFFISLLQETDTVDSLQKLEKYFIEKYNTLSPNGYNLTTGGTYCEMSEETKKLMSEITKRRWKESPDSMMVGFEKCKEYIENKKRKIVGVDIKTGGIYKFNITSEPGVDVAQCLSGKSNYIDNKCWFYDNGQTKVKLIELTEEKLGCKIGNYSKGVNSWKKSDKKTRIEAMKASQSHKFKPLVSVCIESSVIYRYDNVNEAIRNKFSSFGIYQCLKKIDKTGQRRCWFYDLGQSDSFFIEETLKLIGRFKTERTLPFYATNGIIRIDFKSTKDLKNTEFKWKYINKAIKNGYKYKQLNWYYL